MYCNPRLQTFLKGIYNWYFWVGLWGIFFLWWTQLAKQNERMGPRIRHCRWVFFSGSCFNVDKHSRSSCNFLEASRVVWVWSWPVFFLIQISLTGGRCKFDALFFNTYPMSSCQWPHQVFNNSYSSYWQEIRTWKYAFEIILDYIDKDAPYESSLLLRQQTTSALK